MCVLKGGQVSCEVGEEMKARRERREYGDGDWQCYVKGELGTLTW